MIKAFNKEQKITVVVALALVIAVFSFGSIAFPKQKIIAGQKAMVNNALTVEDIEKEVLMKATAKQKSLYETLKAGLKKAQTNDEKIKANKALAYLFQNDLDSEDLVTYYSVEYYKLENSQKTLTFAANFILGDIINGDVPAKNRTFRANIAKGLFEKALEQNPGNDSLKIGLAGCYLHGASTDNPMTGTNMLKEIVAKDSTNAFAQKMMGYGGLMSGQYDKAIIRFVTSYELNNTDTTLVMRIALIAKRNGNKAVAEKYFEIGKTLLKDEKQYLDMFKSDYQRIK